MILTLDISRGTVRMHDVLTATDTMERSHLRNILSVRLKFAIGDAEGTYAYPRAPNANSKRVYIIMSIDKTFKTH